MGINGSGRPLLGRGRGRPSQLSTSCTKEEKYSFTLSHSCCCSQLIQEKFTRHEELGHVPRLAPVSLACSPATVNLINFDPILGWYFGGCQCYESFKFIDQEIFFMGMGIKYSKRVSFWIHQHRPEKRGVSKLYWTCGQWTPCSFVLTNSMFPESG